MVFESIFFLPGRRPLNLRLFCFFPDPITSLQAFRGGVSIIAGPANEISIGRIDGSPKACGVKSPCEILADGKEIGQAIELLPIQRDGDDKWSMYTRIVIGDLSFLSTDEIGRSEAQRPGNPGCVSDQPYGDESVRKPGNVEPTVQR